MKQEPLKKLKEKLTQNAKVKDQGSPDRIRSACSPHEARKGERDHWSFSVLLALLVLFSLLFSGQASLAEGAASRTEKSTAVHLPQALNLTGFNNDQDQSKPSNDQNIHIEGTILVVNEEQSESSQPSEQQTDDTSSKLDFDRIEKSSEYPFRIATTPNPPVFYTTGFTNLQFNLSNASQADLQIVELFLNSSGEGFPFDTTYTKIQGDVSNAGVGSGQYTTVTMAPQRVKEGTADGYYDLEITVRYIDNSAGSLNYNNIYEQKLSYTIRVVGDPENKEDSRVLLAPALLPTQTGTYGQALNLQFGLVNRGFDPVDIISVTPVITGEADTWPFVIAQTDYTQSVGKRLLPLAPGASSGSEAAGTMILCNFGSLLVREDVTSGPKQIEFLVQHKYGNKEIQESKFPIFVNIVGNPNEDAKKDGDTQETWPDSKPRLMCTGFKTSPDKVEGGEDFKLTLTIKNTSALLGVQNIRLVVSSDPVGDNAVPPFITESGASSVFIPWIDPDTEYELDLMMTASVQVPQKAYPLKLEMEYEDVKATPIQASEAISIQLNQAVRMDHGKMELMPEQINVGQQASLNFPIYNKGKTTLYNVTVTVPDNQGITGDEVFLGNINAGSSSLVDMMITADAVFSPEDPRKLKVSYEDENGQVSSQDFEFKLTVMEDMSMGGMDFPEGMPPDMDDAMMGEMEVPSGPLAIMPLWAWILCGVGLFFIILGLILSYRKRKRKKRMTLEDEAYFRDLMS